MPPTTMTTTTMDLNGSSPSTGAVRRSSYNAPVLSLPVFTLLVFIAIALGILPGGSPPAAVHAMPTQLDSDWTGAMEYYTRLHIDWSCNMPQARVIPVQQVHPDAGVAYVTTCVVLHQCAADAGCCPETDVCVAKEQKIVKIPIITHDARTPYRMMTFANHTSCHCVSKQSKFNGIDTNALA